MCLFGKIAGWFVEKYVSKHYLPYTLKIKRWMQENPKDVELLCGSSDALTIGDLLRLRKALEKLKAYNLVSLLMHRHFFNVMNRYGITTDFENYFD